MLDLETLLLKTLEGGSNSLVAIAVGTAEGTRTPDGSYTKNWWGHKDPANKRLNQGSFSYQGAAKNPTEADALQLHKLKTELLPRFEIAVPPHRWKENDRLLLFVTATDVFTQSEAACCAKGGFLDLIPYLQSFSQLVTTRVDAYVDPKTHRIDAPGFNNDRNRLFADQLRRQECLAWAIAHWTKTQLENQHA